MSQAIAICEVLFEQQPNGNGEPFIEIRRWSAAGNDELILEYGRVDDSGELVTTCQVMPFFMDVTDVLATLAG